MAASTPGVDCSVLGDFDDFPDESSANAAAGVRATSAAVSMSVVSFFMVTTLRGSYEVDERGLSGKYELMTA